jgi:hypothetical protein
VIPYKLALLRAKLASFVQLTTKFRRNNRLFSGPHGVNRMCGEYSDTENC